MAVGQLIGSGHKVAAQHNKENHSFIGIAQSEISGEKLLALQRFLAVLQRYNPLSANGHQLVTKLKDYVVQFNDQLTGSQFEEELKRLESQLSPVYSSTHFVGCTGSSPRLRGFSCSLWTLFHFMTVQAASNDESQDPLEVLQAMHGYIKNFFGCTECSEHFQVSQRAESYVPMTTILLIRKGMVMRGG